MAKKQTSRKSFRIHDEQAHPRERAATQVFVLGFFLVALVALASAMMLGV